MRTKTIYKISTLSLRLTAFCLLLTAYCLLNPDLSFSESQPLDISGYYKNLNYFSSSAYTNEDFYAVTQRLRLEFTKQTDPWQFHLTLDNEAIINDFANTPDFTPIRSRTQGEITNIDLDKVSVDNDHLYLKHSIYRAYIKYYSPEFQAVIGKQSIDWGKMRFYSPLDLFNSLGSTDIERDEKIGVDAINLNFSPSAFSGLNVVAAPEDAEKSMYGLKAYHKIGTYDCALLSAYTNKDMVLGASFDGYVKDAGFRGEITYNRQDDKRTFPRISLGTDYNINEKLYVMFEQFYNGGSDDNDLNAWLSYKKSRQIMSLKKHISGLGTNYKITPLWTWDNYTLYDWEGKSIVIDNEIKYNIKQNIDVSAGVQLFWGDNDSEFGGNKNLFFTEVKLFF